MGKRLDREEAEEGRPIAKRLKVHQGGSRSEDITEIKSVQDLKHLLTFTQDDSPRLRLNLQRFRLFLEDVGLQLGRDSTSPVCLLLLDFWKSVTPADDDITSDSLPDLIQAWSFAVQAKNYGLMSAIPGILALLLRTVSAAIDFRALGNRLCRTILREDNMALLDGGLSAPPIKDHLIIPCLRLLCEIVSFDGGSHTRAVYNRRDVTFKRLNVFLGMRNSTGSSSEKEPQKTCGRNCAFQYILLNIRFQDKVAQAELLSQPNLTRVLFQTLSDDSPRMISSFLDTVKTYILSNTAVPKIVKTRLLTDANLRHVANLFQLRGNSADSNAGGLSIPDLAQEVLTLACTSRQHGILIKQYGWYPPGKENEISKKEANNTYDFSSNNETSEKYKNKVPVKNTTLASFLQDLRPWAESREKELTLAIFKSAPELVADYFKRKQNFSFDPKLSVTWIGYSSFLLSVINLPIPVPELFVGDEIRAPPSVSIIMECIMPSPLTPKVLKKCLNHTSTLVRLFAIRIMIAAFQKMQQLITALSSNEVPLLWRRLLSSALIDFQSRFPELSSIVSVFKNCGKDQSVLNDASACLIVQYHKVAPTIAEGEKFDVSTYLTDMLQKEDVDIVSDAEAFPSFGLGYLLEMGNYSFESRWWQKPERLAFSPFTSILRLVSQAENRLTQSIQELLQKMVDEQNVLQHDHDVKSLHALIQSLRPDKDWAPNAALFEFLDNCVLRLVQKPVKYFAEAQELVESTVERAPLSNLFLVIAEQWPFFTKDHEDAEITLLSVWLSRLLKLATNAGEHRQALRAVCHRLQSDNTSKATISTLEALLESGNDTGDSTIQPAVDPPEQARDVESAAKDSSIALDRMSMILHQKLLPSDETEQYTSLSNWHKKDIAEAIEDFDIGNLFLYLSSQHEEIRRQAILQLRRLMSNLQVSNYSNRLQIYLLAGIAAQTSEESVSDGPLPSIASVIAARLTLVLHNPLHCLFGKANQFMNRSPIWNPSKLPSYWIDKIFLSPPEQDEAHQNEVDWLLEAFIQGLRTPADLNLYRRSSVLERVMSLAASPRLFKASVEKVVHLQYRCTLIGGANTLVTRCGTLGWIQEKKAAKAVDQLLLQCLDCKVREQCDQQKTLSWRCGNSFRGRSFSPGGATICS